MRVTTATTTRGGKGVQRRRRERIKCDEEVQEEVGDNHNGEE